MTEPKYNLLLIEDDYFINKAYSAGLRLAGFDVMVANDGEEAMSLLRANRPDLILLDLILPKKDGFAFLKELKAEPATQSIPVIVLSNLSQPKDIEECQKLGAVDFLVKSDTPLYKLTDIIKKYLSVTV